MHMQKSEKNRAEAIMTKMILIFVLLFELLFPQVLQNEYFRVKQFNSKHNIQYFIFYIIQRSVNMKYLLLEITIFLCYILSKILSLIHIEFIIYTLISSKKIIRFWVL